MSPLCNLLSKEVERWVWQKEKGFCQGGSGEGGLSWIRAVDLVS